MERPYVCEYPECKVSFVQKTHLVNHVRSVHTMERYACSECDTSFVQKSHLDRHVRSVHMKERPYVCTHLECGKSFFDRHDLDKHTRTHNGDRPFACDHPGCNASFATKGNLDAHVRTHTGQRPYKCNLCDKAFTTMGSRNAHERRHDTAANEVFLKKKEEWTKRFLVSRGYAFDRELHVSYKACGEDDTWARLDFVLYKEDHVVILSVDELQHADREVLCEVARMSKVVCSIRASGDARRIVWIRFNPDTVRLDGEKVRRPMKDRETVLANTIRASDTLFEGTDQEIAIVYLYYDAHTARDGTLQAEVIGDPDYADTWKQLVSRVVV